VPRYRLRKITSKSSSKRWQDSSGCEEGRGGDHHYPMVIVPRVSQWARQEQTSSEGRCLCHDIQASHERVTTWKGA
jgi:hypothetical protein